MKKLIKTMALAGMAVTAIGLTSCGCCTGEAKAPPLSPLPQFQDLPSIHYGK